MRIIERTEYERKTGQMLSQWMAGAVGAIMTTLPAFLVLPIWFVFIDRYKIVDHDGKEDYGACGAICFVSGLLVWILAFILF